MALFPYCGLMCSDGAVSVVSTIPPFCYQKDDSTFITSHVFLKWMCLVGAAQITCSFHIFAELSAGDCNSLLTCLGF